MICGRKTDRKILGNSHLGADIPTKCLTSFDCGSFAQKQGETKGICNNNLMCTPIKIALKGEPLFNDIGHVVCKYPSLNVSYVMYRNLDENQIKQNYPECLD